MIIYYPTKALNRNCYYIIFIFISLTTKQHISLLLIFTSRTFEFTKRNDDVVGDAVGSKVYEINKIHILFHIKKK